MSDYLPKHTPGNAVTFTASAPVIGGRLVEVTGDRAVAHAGAASVKSIGAAATDAKAGEDVLVLRGGAQKLVTAGAIPAGTRVAPAVGGKIAAVTGDDRGIGLTLTPTTAADQLALTDLD